MTYNKQWRKNNLEKWQKMKKKYYDQFRPAINERQPYTDHDDVMICTSRLSDRDLHEILGRSVEAIQVRRSKIRKRIGGTLILRNKNER
jgi:hypothetical protein